MSASNSAKARDLKQRVLTCLDKLSDRDTHSAAASELESIARNLPSDALPSFISSVSATDSSDKSPVRRHCLKLVSILSEHHGNSLSPHLSKILSAVVRRLRDQDSSVRAACVAASLSLSSHISSPPFTSLTKPFVESLFTEQDPNAQTGAALCLAAVIEGSGNPELGILRGLLPRIEKLAKSENFKAKPAILMLVGSVMAVEGVLRGGGKDVVGNLVNCLMEFFSSEDWATRKAAAEALMKIAALEKELLSEFKASCLKTFEARRFDKVKVTRETISQMIEVWMKIPEELSPAPESEPSSKQNASDSHYPPGPMTSISVGSNTLQTRGRSTGSDVKKTGPAMFQKLDRKKPSGLKVEIVTPAGCFDAEISDDEDEHGLELEKSGNKRALFKDNKLGLFRGGSRVVPCGDTSVLISNETGDVRRNQKECEDMSLIRKQLLQIETQQSNLLDMLRKFIGSSQKGLHSLEARVHGLELALDEISFDLAVSTGRMSQNGAAGAMCCKLPGTDFLSSKLWRKAVSSSSTSQFPMENRRFLEDRHALVVNPLAKVPSAPLGLPEGPSSGAVNTTTA